MVRMIRAHIEQSLATKQLLLANRDALACIEKMGQTIAHAFAAGQRLYLCGNGGSAGDAQHIATELVVRYKSTNNRRALPALALGLDASSMTAVGNDFGFEQLFARQLSAFAVSGDLLLAITTSGNSANIIEALKVAREIGVTTLFLSAGDGGETMRKHSELVDQSLLVEGRATADTQECHIMIGHLLCAIVESELFGLNQEGV